MLSAIMPGVAFYYAECQYAEGRCADCCYAECRYAECSVANILTF